MMDPMSNELFRMALGLASPWTVARVEFSQQEQELDLWLDFAAGSVFACPECGASCKVHDTSERTWRHLDFFQVINQGRRQGSRDSHGGEGL